MPLLQLPTEDEWTINLKDAEDNDLGSITVDELDTLHEQAVEAKKAHGDNLVDCLVDLLNAKFNTDKVKPIIVSLLLNYKATVVQKLKKNME